MCFGETVLYDEKSKLRAKIMVLFQIFDDNCLFQYLFLMQWNYNETSRHSWWDTAIEQMTVCIMIFLAG